MISLSWNRDVARRPEFEMADRLLLHRIDFDEGTVTLHNGKKYDRWIKTSHRQPKDPYKLTALEQDVVNKIAHSFTQSEKLIRHLEYLYAQGSIYLVANKNLLYHASIPLDKKGKFKKIKLRGKTYSGRSFMDKVDQLVRTAYFNKEDVELNGFAKDYMWYLWCGKDSPLFDKSVMTTFERYFIADKETHLEEKGYYFEYRENRDTCEMIMQEFGLDDPDAHIINGHVPVKAIRVRNLCVPMASYS